MCLWTLWWTGYLSRVFPLPVVWDVPSGGQEVWGTNGCDKLFDYLGNTHVWLVDSSLKQAIVCMVWPVYVRQACFRPEIQQTWKIQNSSSPLQFPSVLYVSLILVLKPCDLHKSCQNTFSFIKLWFGELDTGKWCEINGNEIMPIELLYI